MLQVAWKHQEFESAPQALFAYYITTDNYKWFHISLVTQLITLGRLLNCEVFHLSLNNKNDKSRIKHIFNKHV